MGIFYNYAHSNGQFENVCQYNKLKSANINAKRERFGMTVGDIHVWHTTMAIFAQPMAEQERAGIRATMEASNRIAMPDELLLMLAELMASRSRLLK